MLMIFYPIPYLVNQLKVKERKRIYALLRIKKIRNKRAPLIYFKDNSFISKEINN